jgi:hypothetical protein
MASAGGAGWEEDGVTAIERGHSHTTAAGRGGGWELGVVGGLGDRAAHWI